MLTAAEVRIQLMSQLFVDWLVLLEQLLLLRASGPNGEAEDQQAPQVQFFHKYKGLVFIYFLLTRFTAQTWASWHLLEQQHQSSYSCIQQAPGRSSQRFLQGKANFHPLRKPPSPAMRLHLEFGIQQSFDDSPTVSLGSAPTMTSPSNCTHSWQWHILFLLAQGQAPNWHSLLASYHKCALYHVYSTRPLKIAPSTP